MSTSNQVESLQFKIGLRHRVAMGMHQLRTLKPPRKSVAKSNTVVFDWARQNLMQAACGKARELDEARPKHILTLILAPDTKIATHNIKERC